MRYKVSRACGWPNSAAVSMSLDSGHAEDGSQRDQIWDAADSNKDMSPLLEKLNLRLSQTTSRKILKEKESSPTSRIRAACRGSVAEIEQKALREATVSLICSQTLTEHFPRPHYPICFREDFDSAI